MTRETLDDRLAALVGKPISDTGPNVAPDPVNQPMIRHWAAAFEDANPVYTDPDAAARVALRRDRRAAADAPDLDDGDAAASPASPSAAARRSRAGGAEVLDLLDEAGFVGTLASNSEFEIVRYLRLGDVVSADDRARVGVAARSRRASAPATSSRGSRRTPTRRRGRRPPALPHPEVPPGRCSVVSARLAPSMTADTQFFWDGVQEHRLLIQRCAAAARCAIRRGRCARTATRSRGTRSRRRAAAPCSAS